MSGDLPPDLIRWVREGERLFGRALEALQRHEALVEENRRMREELSAARSEIAQLRAQCLEAADTLKGFAEHVTRLATLALERLARRPS
ncbi:MAG TPA: hypothetical protein VFE48_06280 [Methylomirabilota bacterium]|nr:hypothetical protein [Methylomirabilota bacterium]